MWHTRHTYGRSPECTRLCRSRSCLREKEREQYEHENGRALVPGFVRERSGAMAPLGFAAGTASLPCIGGASSACCGTGSGTTRGARGSGNGGCGPRDNDVGVLYAPCHAGIEGIDVGMSGSDVKNRGIVAGAMAVDAGASSGSNDGMTGASHAETCIGIGISCP